MDDKFGANSSQKLTLVLIVIILSLLLYIMNQVPSGGQWFHRPSTKYKGGNEAAGLSYRQTAEQQAYPRMTENRFLYARPVDRDNDAMNRSLFSSPRMMSAKNAEANTEQLPDTIKEISPANDKQDLLEADYNGNNNNVYQNSFGTSRSGN